MVKVKISSILFSFCTLFLFYSCNTGQLEKRIDELELEKKTLQQNTSEKEALIDEFILSINEIETNLEQIKGKENMLTTRFNNSGVEMDNDIGGKIIEDIKLIDELLEKNKSAIASLNNRLKASNTKINGLEEMLERLANQMQQKDAQITSLQEELAGKNSQLRSVLEQYYTRLEELKLKDGELNMAYYCYGTSKELKRQGVITREGSVIGIGGSKKLSKDFNKDYFTVIDIQETTAIELLGEKVKIITNHPSDAYEIQSQEKATVIKITDPKAFWSASKYLVIITE